MKAMIKICMLLIITTLSVQAQDVTHKDIKFKYKKGFLVVSDQNVMKLKYDPGFFYLYDLTSGEEVMYFKLNDNGTRGYFDDDYVKVYFSNAKKSFEIKSYYELVMAKLINEKIMTADWKIDDSKLDDFIAKYDENITNRTIRN